MHIPDGYLSPSTCAVLYGAAAPFWWISLRRMKRVMSTSMVPLLSVFAAFSFVIMMFNLPLPGGTTGHAVGMGIAAIVLGPWAAMLAISIALAIQAFFFGDGGLTAIGANCFNMAIAGSLAAYATYRVVSFRARLTGTRRVVGAAIAGYVGINLSALLAAIEFGIQPLLFHTASGAPLYCPYPLSVSIPAMMIGHLTIAGMAELFLAGGVVAYLQRADPALLERTAPDAPGFGGTQASPRKLYYALGGLVVLTPLGILAAGSAWGEWAPAELKDAPAGLTRLSTLWQAPLARYAPTFVSNAYAGYLISAVAGVLLVVLVTRLFAPRRATGFIEGTLQRMVRKVNASVFAEELSQASGFLQRLHPRVKLMGLLLLVGAAVSVHSLGILAALFLMGMLLGVASKIPLRTLALRIWVTALSLSGVIALPAIFLVPDGWRIAITLILRVETAATFSALLLLTTEWTRILRALRFFRVPVVLVVILGMTYRYLFLLLRTAQEMFEARQSRLVGTLEGPDKRRLATATAGVLLSRSYQLSMEVHSAMQSRGFQGEVYLLDDPAIERADWLALAAFATVATAAIFTGQP